VIWDDLMMTSMMRPVLTWSEEFLGFAARRKMFVEMLFAVSPGVKTN